MSKKRRIILVLALVVWAYFLLGGMLGYVVGFQGSAVLYDRWPGFFIGMGVAALALLGILGVMLIAVPILEWVEKGREMKSVPGIKPPVRPCSNTSPHRTHQYRRPFEKAPRTMYKATCPGVPAASSSPKLSTGKVEHPDGKTTWPFPSQE